MEEECVCLICMEAMDGQQAGDRTCGYCGKRLCASCASSLMELDENGDEDVTNGDLRCPHCRRSLVEGDFHMRRQAIRMNLPSLDPVVVHDIVTLEDLIGRVMQLVAHAETGVEYYNVGIDEVTGAIARDAEYRQMLERLLGSPRCVRSWGYALRRDPTDKSMVSSLCKQYVSMLTETAGLPVGKARLILEEVAQQCLSNTMDPQRYSTAWAATT